MKTKYIILLALCAIVTLSFSFVSSNKTDDQASNTAVTSAPVGGLTMGDEL